MLEFKKGTPESVGIPSKAIQNYVEALNREKQHLHTLTIIKNDTLVFCGEFKPMTVNERTRMYSCSKSFTSMAIGILVGEGKIKLTDRVVDFFPEYDQSKLHKWQLETTIWDLLTMTDCHPDNTYCHQLKRIEDIEQDWVKTWFDMKPTHKPGTMFIYETSNTFLMDVIVQRVTGKEFNVFLQERVLDELGCSANIQCVQAPDGHAWGGSGLIASAMDLTKMGYLLLKGGKINGKQLLPKEYVEMATANQTANMHDNHTAQNRTGYGFQVWQVGNGGFGFFGLGGQMIYAYPELDLLVSTTGNLQNNSCGTALIGAFMNALLLPYVEKKALPENPSDLEALRTLEANLEMSVENGAHDSKMRPLVEGKTYVFPENEAGLKKASMTFREDGGIFHYENATGQHEINFGYEKNVDDFISETATFRMRIKEPGNQPIRVLSNGAWLNDHAIHIVSHITDVCLGIVEISVYFSEDDTMTVGFYAVSEWAFYEYKGCTTGDLEK